MNFKKVLLVVAISITLIIIIYQSFPYLLGYNSRINTLIATLMIKSVESQSEWLSLPLYKFFVNASHNTYLVSTQNLSISSLDAYK